MLRNDPETRGQELFAQNCASCHRLGDLAPADGNVTAPDLTGFGTKEWVLGLLDNPDANRFFGKTPFKGSMPSMVHPPTDPEAAKVFTAMTPADQESVAAFLSAQAKGEEGKGMPGEKIVSQRCTGCHRLDGKTDDEDSLAPELRGWASLAWIEAQIENPASGKAYPKGTMAPDLKGHMPAFGEKLTASDRKILATWVAHHGRQ
jgi:ubiquinol-cytochrome c reductase cytochrome b subunit